MPDASADPGTATARALATTEVSSQVAIATDAAIDATNPITLGKIFAKSGMWKDDRDASRAIVKVLAGRELGIPAVQAMCNVHVFDGKVAIGAAIMGATVKRHPKYDYRVIESSGTRCAIQFFEILPDGEKEPLGPPSEFTLEDAKTAGLTGKKNWRTYPKAMLFNRALAAGVRRDCPDVMMGPVYDPDEIEDSLDVPRPRPRKLELDAAARQLRDRFQGPAGDPPPASTPKEEIEVEAVVVEDDPGPADPQGSDLAPACTTCGVVLQKPSDVAFEDEATVLCRTCYPGAASAPETSTEEPKDSAADRLRGAGGLFS